MSFWRHGEIYPPMRSSAPGRPRQGRPSPHRYDEFPAGYSLAGCAPAEPASASPADTQVGANALSSTIEKQRTVGRPLTACLTQGDNPRGQTLTLTLDQGTAPDSSGVWTVTGTEQDAYCNSGQPMAISGSLDPYGDFAIYLPCGNYCAQRTLLDSGDVTSQGFMAGAGGSCEPTKDMPDTLMDSAEVTCSPKISPPKMEPLRV